MRHKTLSMTHLPLCNISSNDSALPIDCNNKSQQSQIILVFFRIYWYQWKTLLYYYLLIRYYIIWTLLFVVLKFLIMILWFVTCVITFAPFCICKDTKYNQKCKILNVWKNIIYKLTFCTHDDYKQLINDNSLTLYRIITPLQTK